jgi:hypothetical protein
MAKYSVCLMLLVLKAESLVAGRVQGREPASGAAQSSGNCQASMV